MKLRNKKTGEISEFSGFYLYRPITQYPENIYESLAELNANWEDYEPKEPLIKDEKGRKAFRDFAKEHNITRIKFEYGALGFLGDEYTIDELCGEEEE